MRVSSGRGAQRRTTRTCLVGGIILARRGMAREDESGRELQLDGWATRREQVRRNMDAGVLWYL